SATGRAADFFRIGDKVGYLKPGAQADFVILSIDPEDTM
ncbi:MAG: amidohydrolase family protein, partial [Tissierellia bacterium]|nr:amidohydrolase family protein [Tissierellia bacterium]